MADSKFESIFIFAAKKPAWALIYLLIIVSSTGGAAWSGINFFGRNNKSSTEHHEVGRLIEEAEINLEKLMAKLWSKHVEEMTRYRDEGKLQSSAEIRLVIKEELENFEERLYRRLNIN